MSAMLSLLLLALAAPASDGCRTYEEEGPLLCPARLPPRRWVTVDAAGKGTRWRVTDEPPCSRFRPTAADVTRFLTRAVRTDKGSVHATLPESPCYAEGRVKFRNGQVGRYWLTRLDLMRLTIGRGPEIILYCRTCEFGGLNPG